MNKNTDSALDTNSGTKTVESITDILDIAELQKIQDAFSDATGVASVITDPNGVPITKPSNFCRLCMDIIRKSPKGLRNCLHSDSELGRRNPGGPIMQPCLSGGLWDGGASITAGKKHIANWLIGQIKNKDIPYDRMLSYAREIEVNEDEFMEALSEVKEMSTEQFAKVCSALYLIANQISQLAYNNMRLKESESSLHATLSSIADAVISADTAGNVTLMNPVAEKLTGLSFAESAGKHIDDIITLFNPSTGKAVKISSIENRHSASAPMTSYSIITGNGDQLTVSENSAPIISAGGVSSGKVFVLRDESERIKLESQLIQTQKMDAIGQLAGGVAHDFNNMLAGIIGAVDLIKSAENIPNEINRMADIILESSERAASLTGKLLDFSRKGKHQNTLNDIHLVIETASAILERSIDKKITIEKDMKALETTVMGDAAQLQSSILNLGVNARDAMPDGGTLSISTENIVLSEEECGFFRTRVTPGKYVIISISDTGSGMTQDVMDHIFEPFFTTKEVGKGTGLGLSAVYGMIRDHSGAVHVYSEPGYGSIFKIYLPVFGAASIETKVKNIICNENSSGENLRILVVDDEPLVREIITAMLCSMGHTPFSAENGQAALSVLKNDDGFDLVVLDVVMPVMDGRETYSAIRNFYPDMPVLFSSGFTQNKKIDELINEPGVIGFIQKPYRSSSLKDIISKFMSKRRR